VCSSDLVLPLHHGTKSGANIEVFFKLIMNQKKMRLSNKISFLNSMNAAQRGYEVVC